MDIKFSHQTQCPKCYLTTVTIESIKHGVIYECQHCGVMDLVEFKNKEAHDISYVYTAGENVWLPNCVGKD
jgi:predicted SprT family Zn-dependent metalloprotease